MKTMKERLNDNADFSMPRVVKGTCKYCDAMAIGVKVQDFNRELQHSCFSCIAELNTLFK